MAVYYFFLTMVVLSVLFSSITCTIANDFPERSCLLEMHFFKEYGSAVSIFAGRFIPNDEVVELTPIIVVKEEAVKRNIMDDYVEGWNASHCSLVLGYSMVYNHAKVRSVGNFRVGYDERLAYMKAEKDIQEGEEMFFHYGPNWFITRGKQERESLNLIPTKETRIPGCPDAVAEIRNGRVFSKVQIYPGEVIETARGLIFPASHLKLDDGPLYRSVWRSSFSLYLNNTRSGNSSGSKTCPNGQSDEANHTVNDGETTAATTTSSCNNDDSQRNVAIDAIVMKLFAVDGGGDYATMMAMPVNLRHRVIEMRYSMMERREKAMLLLGWGALYQHPKIGDTANVDYYWWDKMDTGKSKSDDIEMESSDEGDVQNIITREVNNTSISKSAVECGVTMLVQFRANRLIEPGEELTINLFVDESGNRYTDENFQLDCFFL